MVAKKNLYSQLTIAAGAVANIETKASQRGHHQAKNIIIDLIASVEGLLQMFGTSCIQIIAEIFFLQFGFHLYQVDFGQTILGSSC